MPELSSVDRNANPPRVDFPRQYNAAYDLIGRNLKAGRADKIAFIDDAGSYSYGELAKRANRFANVITALGVQPEQRVLLCMVDTIDWPVAFLGCILAGVIPVAVNTLLTTDDYEYMLRDSRSRALLVSDVLWPKLEPLMGKIPSLQHVIVSGQMAGNSVVPRLGFSTVLESASEQFTPAETSPDEACFWLYSSGSTGAPKGTVHIHSSLINTAELFAGPVLGLLEDDVVFSAAKLFFAYGLGNGLTFPMAVGATALLMAERAIPEAVFKRLREQQPTIFYGVPTLFASLLASPALPARGELRMRLCTSAGEALPADIGKRWTEHFGVEILDGIGSTEMLHVFLSNRAGKVRYGTTGLPIPGYDLRVVDDQGHPLPAGEVGELQIRGATAASAYWNNREKSRDTFQGPWTRSGDKYSVDADGYYTYSGRSDDMLKVGGIYVSPIEVESALITHPAVLEAAVIGRADEAMLVKPQAFVVLNSGFAATDALASELQQHVKSKLAPYKYPRWIEFIDELPKTATGKIQRFRLRARSAGAR